MFYKWHNGEVIIVVVAVDNLTLTSSSKVLLLESKMELRGEFNITEMGEIRWLLGVEVKWDRTNGMVTLSQKAYIDTITNCFSLQDAKPAHTPMETGAQLMSSTEHNDNKATFPYKEIVGSLMYAATATRPDITFATSLLDLVNPSLTSSKPSSHTQCYPSRQRRPSKSVRASVGRRSPGVSTMTLS